MPPVDAATSLRILHVISSMGVSSGGPPVICAGIAGASAAIGNSVTILTVDSAGAQVPVDPAVAFHSFPSSGSGRYGVSEGLAAWLAANIGSFDVVHIHGIWEFSTWAAAKAARKAGIPYVILLNGMLEHYSITNRSYWTKRVYWLARGRRIFEGAAALHCGNTAEIRQAVPWIADLPKFIVGNGVNAKEIDNLPAKGRFRAAHPEIGSRPFALFLSRIHPKKGLERLIPAWKKLAAANPDAQLVIAGHGDAACVKNVDDLIAQHGPAGTIIRVGQLTGEAKWQAIVDADLFVLPSYQEGFSMAITEAMGAGCPVVITAECNFDEVEDPQLGPCGVIVKGGDMNQFIAAMEKLFQDPAARARVGANASALVRSRFTWQQIASDLDKIYRHVLAKKPLPPDGRDVWRQPS